MTKTITIRELTELLHAQEVEIREEYQDKVKRLVAENERLSICLTEEYKKSREIAERLERKVVIPNIVGTLNCDPVDITEQFDYKNIPCLDDAQACVSCGS
jgi:Asp-tRNA(Asn)/Glu-tRNA(Gln) amidotransferase A subunit family amidase